MFEINLRSLARSDIKSILSARWNKKLTFYCIGSNTLYPNIFEIILHFEKKPKLRILESGFIDKNLHVVQSIYYITTYYKVPRGKLMNIYFMMNKKFSTEKFRYWAISNVNARY